MPNDPSLDSAGRLLADFASGPVIDATRAIDEAVDRTFKSVEHSIARSVIAGRASFSDLVTSILRDLDRLAARSFLVQPLEGALSQIVSSILPVGGARAAGGPVEAGSAYLVGENGPEMFVPSSNGAIAPNARPSIVLNVQARDAQSFLKSETQIAAMLSRALARGQRNM
jgi:phage-related minor tail protein